MLYAKGSQLKSSLIDQKKAFNLVMQLKQNAKSNLNVLSEAAAMASKDKNKVALSKEGEGNEWNHIIKILRNNPELLMKVIPSESTGGTSTTTSATNAL